MSTVAFRQALRAGRIVAGACPDCGKCAPAAGRKYCEACQGRKNMGRPLVGHVGKWAVLADAPRCPRCSLLMARSGKEWACNDCPRALGAIGFTVGQHGNLGEHLTSGRHSGGTGSTSGRWKKGERGEDSAGVPPSERAKRWAFSTRRDRRF